MAINLTALDTTDFEAGVYRARLKSLETAEGSIVDEKTGEPRPYMKWTFDLLDEDYTDRELRGNSSMAFGSRAKARAWAEALLGRRIENGETVSEEDLIGKECDLMVRLEETDRGTFAKVESVNPVRKKKGKTEASVDPSKAAAETAEEDDDELESALLGTSAEGRGRSPALWHGERSPQGMMAAPPGLV